MEIRKLGQPTKYEKRMTRTNVMLDDNTLLIASMLGNGNVSAGIRIAVAVCENLGAKVVAEQSKEFSANS